MSRKHLSLTPLMLKVIHGRAEAWRYEEGAGITIVVHRANGDTVQVRVPVSVMRDFLARYDRPADQGQASHAKEGGTS